MKQESASDDKATNPHWSRSAVGASLALFLVLLPGVALLWYIPPPPKMGLPVIAIFGITILLGALAMVSTLFARLKLDNKKEALGLPSGSIRAFIALSLIVLFALISIMVFESFVDTYSVKHLTVDERTALFKDPANHIVLVVPHCENLAAPGPNKPRAEAADAAADANDEFPACKAGQTRTYEVHLARSLGGEAMDLSKQLLVLIGTLMTSVTSFYFASRAGEANTKTMVDALRAGAAPPPQDGNVDSPAPMPPTPSPPPAKAQADPDNTVDGCEVSIGKPTADTDLPASKGGVV